MQTRKGIEIHLIRGDNGRIPLEAPTGAETFVRVPEGPFKVRVHTAKTAEVKIDLDGEPAFTTKVRAGTTEIDADDDERPLCYKTGDGQIGEQSANTDSLVTQTGHVTVSVRHTRPKQPLNETPANEEPWERVVFQMQAPGAAYNETIAHNLHRIESPIKDDEGCGCGTFHAGDHKR
jgi:hypothetical protein